MEIYNFLKNNNFDFIYGLEYPNQINTSYKCDFYLKKFDYYIEYTGMLNFNRTEKVKKILDEYKHRLNCKKIICIENNLKHYFSNFVNNILNFIMNLNEEKS